jgi:uncharacterized protein YjbJ (UPF0337 family)
VEIRIAIFGSGPTLRHHDDGRGLEKGRVMDWNRFEGNWKQFKGNVKEKWGRLTDDDLDVINGQREQLEGKIQERYGIAKDQARQDVEDWFKTLP